MHAPPPCARRSGVGHPPQPRDSPRDVGSRRQADAPVGAPERYKRGYNAPHHLRETIVAAHTTQLWRSLGAVATDLAAAGAALAGAAYVTTRFPLGIGVVLAILLAVVVTSRSLRGLENMIHEASHFNWSRRHRRTNDVLAAMLAAAPTGSRISHYRVSHLLHHGQFGTAIDPDRQRYEDLDLEDLDRSSYGPFVRGMARRFIRYEFGWLREMGTSPRYLAVPVCWTAVVLFLPLVVLAGWGTALVAAGLWVVSFGVGLPAVRFVSEVSEHSYRDAQTVFDATLSNTGFLQRLVFHPHNDGFHTVHHMWPGVPHHALRRLHATLLTEDATGYAARLRNRTSVLQSPGVRLTGVERSDQD